MNSLKALTNIESLRNAVIRVQLRAKNIESKNDIKDLHYDIVRQKTLEICKAHSNWENELTSILANGDEIIPEKIDPELIILPRKKSTKEKNAFKVSTLLWSIPVSNGFGRRIRFVVRDNQNDKIMAIVGLQDPVFSRKARDDYIGWNPEQRKRNLVNMMSCYVLGALPPYNVLLGGKLASMLINSKIVHSEFENRYFDTEGTISKEKKQPQFVAVTNLTAFGKSAMMERIRYPKWKFIGYTNGVNTILHNDGVFTNATKVIKEFDKDYFKTYEWGKGPNWRLRILRKAFSYAEIKQNSLNQGIRRGIYFAPLADNWEKILKWNRFIKAKRNLLTSNEIWKSFKPKVIQRSQRKIEWKNYSSDISLRYIQSILTDDNVEETN